MDKVDILGVKVNKITRYEAVECIFGWLSGRQQRIIVTPNIEFIIKAQKDSEFRVLLNEADLSIPDSSHFGWLIEQKRKKNPLSKIVHWLTFPFSSRDQFPVVTGVDLMTDLCHFCGEKGFVIGLIGGGKGVAEVTAECLKKSYPGLKISFVISDLTVDDQGHIIEQELGHSKFFNLPRCDILFVALGQGKQERWIDHYKNQIEAKVFMGVGGAFDYISGVVPRAPLWMRSLGFEWLYRLILQPWRVGRQLKIASFVLQLLFSKERG